MSCGRRDWQCLDEWEERQQSRGLSSGSLRGGELISQSVPGFRSWPEIPGGEVLWDAALKGVRAGNLVP